MLSLVANRSSSSVRPHLFLRLRRLFLRRRRSLFLYLSICLSVCLSSSVFTQSFLLSRLHVRFQRRTCAARPFSMRVWSHAAYLAKLQAEKHAELRARLLATGRRAITDSLQLGIPRDFAYCLDQRANMAGSFVARSRHPPGNICRPELFSLIARSSERIFVIYIYMSVCVCIYIYIYICMYVCMYSRSLRGLFK